MKTKITVYFIPITHHDLGYTENIEALLSSYCRYYDSILDFCDRTDGYPEEAKYRYTVEEFWSLDTYLSRTTEENRTRMKKRIKEGRIELPALYANIIDCTADSEELIRSMYPSMRYADECGVKITRASLTDMPGLGGGVAEALSGAGIKYLFAGFPRYFEWADAAGKIPEMKHTYWSEQFGRPAAFRWGSESGGSVLTWFQSGYGWFGNNENACVEINGISDIAERLPVYIKELKERGYPYNIMRYIYRGSDNEAPSADICDIVTEWNSTLAGKTGITLEVATDSRFFDRLSEICGDVPVVTGELPHTDYPVLTLTEAGTTAENRRARHRLEIAERMGADGGDAFRDIILYDEHCFGMSRSCGEEHELDLCMKRKYALRAAYTAKKLTDSVSVRSERLDGVFRFFFPQGTKGRATAEFSDRDIEAGIYRIENLRTGEVTHGQATEITDPMTPVPGLTDIYAESLCSGGARRCIFDLGEAVPMSVGEYRITKLSAVGSSCGMADGNYRFDTASYSLFDCGSGRTLTEPGLGRLISRDAATGKVTEAIVTDAHPTFDGPAASGFMTVSHLPGVPEIITEYVLYHAEKRLSVSVRILLDRTPARETFIAFPFRNDGAEFTYDTPCFEGKAFDTRLEGCNTNHCSVTSRAVVSGKNGRVTLDMREGGQVFFGGLHVTEVSQAHHMINPPGFEDGFVKQPESGNVYVMLAYNNCRTNFSMSQTGEAIYRFDITSSDSRGASALFPPEEVGENFVPMLPHVIPSEENIEIVHIKPAENRSGTVIRLRETDGKEAEFSLDTGCGGKTVICDHCERPTGETASGRLKIKPNGFMTVMFTPETTHLL